MSRLNFSASELHELWYSQMTNAELCYALGVARSTLNVLRVRYKLDRRPVERNNPKYKNDHTPTPEEIAERAAAVRAKWSDEERERRLVAAGRLRWSMPSYAFNRREHSFSEVCH